MGQATVDLPDPSETPAAPIASADDLLSQMAGDEIDRLLAEAEVEKGPAPVEPGEASAGDALISSSVPDAELDQLLQDIASESDEGPAFLSGEAIASPEASAAIAPDASDLPQQAPVAISEAASAGLDPQTAAREIDQVLAGASVETLPEVKPPETETSHEEKSALAEVSDALNSPTAEATQADAEPSIPFYLKPLILLNAPMMLLPEAMREALSKIAILTMMNAIAVFIYVLFFRKH